MGIVSERKRKRINFNELQKDDKDVLKNNNEMDAQK